jgi:hypothetical protein
MPSTPRLGVLYLGSSGKSACLAKHEALTSNPNTSNKKKERKNGEVYLKEVNSLPYAIKYYIVLYFLLLHVYT